MNISKGKKHGMIKTRVYNIWEKMRARCSNKKNPKYKYYGGKGIKVCERWSDFRNFFEDMGHPPSNQHSLDRINNDGDYEPINCRWATHFEQANNRSNNHSVEHHGSIHTIAQWGRKLGMRASCLRYMLVNGYDLNGVKKELNLLKKQMHLEFNN